MNKPVFALIVALALLVSPCVAHAADPDPGDGKPSTVGTVTANDAVKKAIPYLWREGEAWINERGCVSCHQVPAMLWSLSLAQEHGFNVGAERLAKWKAWSVKPESFVKPDPKENLDIDKTLSSNIDTMNALLIAIGQDEDLGMDWQSQFTGALVTNQRADGSWKACGQLPLQKRPSQESTQVTVLWTLLALAQQGVFGHDRDAALQVAHNDKPTSTEWWVARLLLADQTNDPQADSIRRQLVSFQNDDGGWGWLTEESSDALATGMALYALRAAKVSSDADSAVFAAATDFLIATQGEDGSWRVPGTKKTTRQKTTPTSNYWGSAWAVIGLLGN